MQANASIHIAMFENISKNKDIAARAGPPLMYKPSIWIFIKPKRLSEDNVDNIVRRQFIKQIQENASKYKYKCK